MKAVVFTTLFVTLFSLSATADHDSYTIYLNNKLVLKQAVNEPLNLQGLQLDKANETANWLFITANARRQTK